MTAEELKAWTKERWPEARENKGQFYIEDKLRLVIDTRFPGRIDVLTDENLRKALLDKYESISTSQVFGIDGVCLLLTGQIEEEEVKSLIIQSFGVV